MNMLCVSFLIVTFSCLFVCSFGEDEIISSENYIIEGKVVPPEIATPEWLSHTRILVNGGEHLGFLKHDGSFSVNHLSPGSYIVEVANPDSMYEPVRVDINSRGKMRARKINYIQTSLVQTVNYPLKFKAKGPYKYFLVRETWRITDFLFSPMVLMMILPLLLIMVIPKLMSAADPETQKEIQQMQMPKYDMPELSEMMTSFFTGGKKTPAVTAKSGKAPKKRQQQT